MIAAIAIIISQLSARIIDAAAAASCC